MKDVPDAFIALLQPDSPDAHALRALAAARGIPAHVAPPKPTTDADEDRKVMARLQARAALAGWELQLMPDGEWVAKRWDRMAELPTIASVERFLTRVGAPG